MEKQNQKNLTRKLRTARTRARISGTAGRPRLSVFRSNKMLYAQLIDDVKGATLAAASLKEIKSDAKRIQKAGALGKLIAEKAKKINVTAAVFDRGGYAYHGRVKALADGAREGGLRL